jgi:hypothetical protein
MAGLSHLAGSEPPPVSPDSAQRPFDSSASPWQIGNRHDLWIARSARDDGKQQSDAGDLPKETTMALTIPVILGSVRAERQGVKRRNS